ncbi:vesicle transport v-snare protein vti1 [Ceraceosorus bombacis]|uniref:Vesicle transport v-snare protein vti1 n=1 Tax=Ceraceosorus bombacis TaxID=401625 RepID=A0A0P1BE19_9BASI|nr:vesicle transport v-snare protein vti1 [Ceraceosorus bombacis]
MTELYSSYTSDYEQLLSSIQSTLDSVSSAKGEARAGALRRADMEADEAEEIVAQMELEVQGMPQAIKSRYQVEMRGKKAELEGLRKRLRQAAAQSSGRDLPPSAFNGDSGDLESGLADTQAQRQRLLQGTATLEDGSRRLEDSHRLALQTEDLGADILRNLRGQREQIEHSRDTLRQADSNIDRSSRTLQQMIRRAKQQKLTMGAILAVLVLLILLILYSKFS